MLSYSSNKSSVFPSNLQYEIKSTFFFQNAKLYIPSLSVFAGLVCVNSHLYAIGGYDGRNQLSTVERYNIAWNVWEPRASMQYSRSAQGVAVHQGRIFVLG